MKKILTFSIVVLLSFATYTCDKPDALKEKAYLEIENTSSSDYITGVYYSNSGYGTNKISSYIGPGDSKTFTLDAEGDYIYNIKVTCDNTSYSDYMFDDVRFYDERRVTVRLTDDGWDDYFSY